MKLDREAVQNSFHWILLVLSLNIWLHLVPSIFFPDVLRFFIKKFTYTNFIWLVGGSALLAGFISYAARQTKYIEITAATVVYVLTMGFAFTRFWNVEWLFPLPLRVLGVVFVSSAVAFSGAWIGRVVWLLGQRTEVSQK